MHDTGSQYTNAINILTLNITLHLGMDFILSIVFIVMILTLNMILVGQKLTTYYQKVLDQEEYSVIEETL